MNKLSMSNVQNLVDIKPVSNETSLDDTYVTTVQLAIAGKTIKNRGDSCYFRLRYEVVQLANELMKKKDITDSKDLDWDLVSAIFITALDGTEKRMDSQADKRPAVWVNAKSQLKAGLEEGFDFIDDPGIGQSALRDAVKEIRDAKAEKKRLEKIREEFGEKGLAEAEGTAPNDKEGGDAGDLPAEAEGKKPKTPAATGTSTTEAGKVVVKTQDREFTDPKLAAAVAAFTVLLMDLEATEGENKKKFTGSQVALRTVNSAALTAEESLDSFKAAMQKLAQAS